MSAQSRPVRGDSDIASIFRLNLEHGERVIVCHDMVTLFAGHLQRKLDKRSPFDWRDPEKFLGDDEGEVTVSQFFAVGNSINFRYWFTPGGTKYCEGMKDGKHFRGANYMWRCLKVCHDNETFSILDSRALAAIKVSDARRIFMDDNDKNVMPAIEERVANLRDLGTKLGDYWSGHFVNLVQEAANARSLRLFVKLSRQFRAFDDPLCKMTMVNAIMHSGRGLVTFDEPIFPGMDYELLKQEMRNGILELNDTMKNKLRKGILLTAEESRELRNAGLSAFLEIMKLTSLGGDVLDNVWWFNRSNCETHRPVCKINGEEKNCFFYGVCPERTEYLIPVEDTRYY